MALGIGHNLKKVELMTASNWNITLVVMCTKLTGMVPIWIPGEPQNEYGLNSPLKWQKNLKGVVMIIYLCLWFWKLDFVSCEKKTELVFLIFNQTSLTRMHILIYLLWLEPIYNIIVSYWSETTEFILSDELDLVPSLVFQL